MIYDYNTNQEFFNSFNNGICNYCKYRLYLSVHDSVLQLHVFKHPIYLLCYEIYIYKTFKKLYLKIFLELLFVLNIPDLIIIITVFFKPTNPFLHHF